MTTAQARAVPSVFSGLRSTLLASAAVGVAVALVPAATAAPICSGDGTANTCVIGINVGEANVATESVDGLGNTDTLQFNSGNLTLDQSAIGSTLSATVRFANFEAAIVKSGATLNMTSAGASTITQSLVWTVEGTLNVTGGNAIGDASAVTVAAGGVFNVNDNEGIGSLAGAGGVTIFNGKILSVGFDNSSTTFSGVISGAGGFTKLGGGTLTLSNTNTFTGPLAVSGGTLKLTAANTMSGPVTVNGGTLEIGHANALAGSVNGVTISSGAITSRGVGNFVIPSNVTITTTTALSRLTGNATINGNLQTNGGLQPGNASVPTWPAGAADNPGQDMGQITINGNYEATGTLAYVGMFIDIDASAPAGGLAGTDKDFLTINGNIIGTNKTKFSVASFDEHPIGAATTGDGIQVIRITGTSANAGQEFFQGNALVAGPHQYLLRYIADYAGGTDDGYFLQSTARDELIAQAGLLSAGQALIRSCFRDDQRIPDSPKGATYGRAWFGYRQGSNSFGPDTGVEQDQDFSCTNGGMDWRMGAGWFGGVSGGFGSSSGDIVVPSGNAKLDGDARVIEAYAAFTSSAFFLNLSAGYADMDWTMVGRLGSAAGSSGGFIGSAQAGVGLGLEPLAVKLIGTVSYDGTNCGDSCMGVSVSEDTGLIEAKGALRFDGVTWGGSIRPWAQVAYSTILSDGINTVKAGPYTVVSDTNDELLAIDGGLQTYLDENLSLYLDGGYNESLSKDISGYRAGIGMKLYW